MNDTLVHLFPSGAVWHAQFLGPAADEVRAVFGDACLPTGYSALTPGHEVREALLRTSPHWTVTLTEGPCPALPRAAGSAPPVL
jgi:hypothetical protein